MKKGIILIGLMLWSCVFGAAQNKIELRSPRQQHTEVHLYDEEEIFLLTLPLTFSLTDKNILIMMVGNDIKLMGGQTVWMFSQEMKSVDLEKSDRNVSVTKSFKNRNTKFYTVLMPHEKITIHREFDDGYEIVKKNAKPVFFKISESSSGSLRFYLQFYVAKSDSKYPYVFISGCNPIEVELIK